jgi:hypothetical protein
MKFYVSLCFITILFSCTNKQEKVVRLDDLVSGAKAKYEKKDTLDSLIQNKPLSFFVNRLCDSLHLDKSKVELDSVFAFPERFHPTKSDKVVCHDPSLISYKHWKWTDSIKATQAFFNWLDQLGERKVSMLVGDELKVSKNGFILLLQDKSIVFLEFGSTFKPIHYIHKLTNCGFGKHWKYIVYQQPFKKTTWIDCITDTTKCPLYPIDK